MSADGELILKRITPKRSRNAYFDLEIEVFQNSIAVNLVYKFKGLKILEAAAQPKMGTAKILKIANSEQKQRFGQIKSLIW